MAGKDKKPEIRFAGFTDAWEQCKLSDYLDTSSAKNSNDDFSKSDVLSVSGDFGIINQIEFKGRSFAGASISNYGIVDNGDVVYTKSPLKANPYGIIKTNKGKPGVVSTLYAVYKPKNNVNSNFIQCYFDYDYRLNQYLKPLVNKGAKNDMKVSDDNALIGLVTFPNYEEQTRIVEFFECLDELITLHQRKYDKLVIVKKSMLEKMFPKDGANVPEIRFAGFTEAWEQRKLGEIVDRVVRKNSNLESTLPLTISAQYGLVDQITYFNNRVASRDLSNYYLLKKGDFAYNKSYSEGFPFGAVKRLDNYEMGVLSILYIVFAPKSEIINSDYLVSYYDTNNWHRQVAERAAEGARNHGLLNISADDFFDTELKFPKEKSEQSQIGKFFAHFDKLITLHLSEIEKLKNIKKSMLEKMFV